MKQTQPPTTTPEAALRPVPGQKTATGVSDTWSRANLWGTQTFTTELRWGVRYSQSDPLGTIEQGLFAYVGNNPLNDVDPKGQASCLWWLWKCAERERDCTDFWRGEFSCMPIDEVVDFLQRASDRAGRPINSEVGFFWWFCHETMPQCQQMYDTCPRFIASPPRPKPRI